MTVTFCGNRDVAEKIVVSKKLYDTIKILIESGAKEFLLGGYGDFDVMAAMAVKELKAEYPQIKSIIILPYLTKKYNSELYDCSVYPELERIPKKAAIIKRNEYMVNKADIVISYVKYTYGGSYKTLEYAKKKNKQIIDII